MKPHCIVVQHQADCPPGLLAAAADRADTELVVLHPYRGDPLPDDLHGVAGLVVLGGSMSAYDDALHLWLTATKGLVAQAVVADLPFLGICLGHQLAAVALGGQVRTDPHGPGLGPTPFTRTAEGRTDALVGHLPDDALATQWNRDVVTTLPPGAIVLARDTHSCPQAVRFSRFAWGLQGHPEATTDIVDAWAADAALPVGGRCPAEAAAEVRAQEAMLEAWWSPTFAAFFDLVFKVTNRAPGDERPVRRS